MCEQTGISYSKPCGEMNTERSCRKVAGGGLDKSLPPDICLFQEFIKGGMSAERSWQNIFFELLSCQMMEGLFFVPHFVAPISVNLR